MNKSISIKKQHLEGPQRTLAKLPQRHKDL